MDINKQSDIPYTLLSTQSIVCPSTGMGRASRLQWCSGDQSSKKFSGTALELKRPPERRRAVSGGEIYKSKLSPWFSSSQWTRRIWQNKRRSISICLFECMMSPWQHHCSLTGSLITYLLQFKSTILALSSLMSYSKFQNMRFVRFCLCENHLFAA